MKKYLSFILAVLLIFTLFSCGQSQDDRKDSGTTVAGEENIDNPLPAPEGFVSISGGTFTMGSPEDEGWRGDDETQHTVTASDFYMSRFELTQKEYREVMGENPSNFTGDDLPVENISWYDAIAYCNARSKKRDSHLPTRLTEQPLHGTVRRTVIGFRLRQNGNMPAVPERVHRFILPLLLTQRKQTITVTTPTAIAKLAPTATMGDALSVHYSGGSSLSSDVSAWLEKNEINRK